MTAPETIDGGLRAIADWMDVADQLIDTVFSYVGRQRPNRGDEVQQELRRLADWFQARPEAALHAWSYMRTGASTPQIAAQSCPIDSECADPAHLLIASAGDREVVRIHYGDPDTRAEAWNDGWDAAHRQAIGGQESRDWLLRTLARHGVRPTTADDIADELLADVTFETHDPGPLAEWQCPSCGATTRARMADQQPAPFVLDTTHLTRQREWSQSTFGPGRRTGGICDHIRKELKEIADDPTDIKEWVDVVILALDGAWRAGGEPQEILDAIRAKQLRNEARVWPDWRGLSEDVAIEHDRTVDEHLGDLRALDVDGVCGRRCAAHPPVDLPDVALAQVDRGDSRGAFAYLRAALVQRLRVRS